MIVILSYSQEQKNFMIDSNNVTVKYKNIVAANKITTEWISQKQIILLSEKELLLRTNQINYLNQSLENQYKQIQIKNLIINDYKNIDKLRQNQISNLNKLFKQEKTKTIILYTSIPVTAILSFLLGFYIHK